MRPDAWFIRKTRGTVKTCVRSTVISPFSSVLQGGVLFLWVNHIFLLCYFLIGFFFFWVIILMIDFRCLKGYCRGLGLVSFPWKCQGNASVCLCWSCSLLILHNQGHKNHAYSLTHILPASLRSAHQHLTTDISSTGHGSTTLFCDGAVVNGTITGAGASTVGSVMGLTDPSFFGSSSSSVMGAATVSA